MKRSIHRFVPVFLAIAVALCAPLFAVPAYADSASDRAVAAFEAGEVFYPKDDSKLERFKARVFNGLLDHQATIDVSDIGITAGEIAFRSANGSTLTGTSALAGITRAHPLFSTLCVGWSGFSFSYNGSAVSSVSVTYLTWTWPESLTTAFKTQYAEFIADVPANANELQKALYVHDWICGHVSYSMQIVYNPEFAIGAIANGKALCAGYAYAYQFLAQQLGLECNYVAGTTKVEAHAWNKVRVCGEWFLVDTTWDNSLAGTTNYSHTYCLLNDAEFAAAGDGSHDSDKDVTGNEPVNTKTSFANKFWQSVCGAVPAESYNQDPQLNCDDHVWDAGAVAQEPTCGAEGSKTFTCALCGTTKTEALPATGQHVWDAGVVTKEATCAEAGVKKFTCTACGATKEETIPKTNSHSWDAGTVTTPATCTAAGIKTFTCNVCKATRTEAIPATGHAWDAGTVTKEATCTEKGTKTFTCSTCKITKTEDIAALGHNSDGGKQTKAPTCTEKGTKTYSCTRCGTVLKTEDIPALGHDRDAGTTVAATCAADGSVTYRCTRCKEVLETTAIPKLDHASDGGKQTKASTCTAAGTKTYSCTRCKATIKTEDVPALGHDRDAGTTVAATCTADGSVTYRCTRCDAVLETTAIPKLDHASDGGKQTKAPTCTEKGTKTYSCTRCGALLSTEDIPAPGHDWGAGTVTTRPTYAKEGVKTYTCSRCKQIRTEPVAKLASKAMYRLYNRLSGEHLYTSDVAERDACEAAGWTYEKVGWYAPEESRTPVYRLYNPYAPGGEHHYTMDAAEVAALVAQGWKNEGVKFYSDDAKGVPVYREYNPNAFSNNHNYTADVDEHNALVKLGWNDEEIGWYGAIV